MFYFSKINDEEKFTILFQEPIITYARELRQNQTKAEKFLWEILRDRKFHGHKCKQVNAANVSAKTIRLTNGAIKHDFRCLGHEM